MSVGAFYTALMETEIITLEVPLVFGRLAKEHYKVSPERILNAFAYSFCLHPPCELILVQRAARPKSSDAVALE